MNKISPLFWPAIFLIILLPTAAGRLIVDLAGGLLIVFTLIPLILIGSGWIGWKIIQSKMTNCPNCGASYFKSTNKCPLCGTSSISVKDKFQSTENIPASSATIDIKPK